MLLWNHVRLIMAITAPPFTYPLPVCRVSDRLVICVTIFIYMRYIESIPWQVLLLHPNNILFIMFPLSKQWYSNIFVHNRLNYYIGAICVGANVRSGHEFAWIMSRNELPRLYLGIPIRIHIAKFGCSTKRHNNYRYLEAHTHKSDWHGQAGPTKMNKTPKALPGS